MKGRSPAADQAPDGDPLKHLSELFLKDDDDHNHQDREKALKHPRRHLKIEVSGEQENRAEDKNAAHDEYRARALRPHDRGVKQDGDEDDVDELAEGNADKRIEDIFVPHEALSAGRKKLWGRGSLEASSAAVGVTDKKTNSSVTHKASAAANSFAAIVARA
jgi:hypothetical protein